jgi:hypothetical protein
MANPDDNQTSTTTTAPSTTTTAPSTTTTAPSTTTTAPSTTTTAPSTTTTAPGATTTAPGTTTTAPGATTTAGDPVVQSFTGRPKEDDGSSHLPDSVEAEAGSTVVLEWTISGAPDGVELTDSSQAAPQTLDANTLSTEVTPQEATQDYTLVALSGSVRSASRTVHVSTHAAGDQVSPHASVTAPDGWFELTVDGGANATVRVYHEGTLMQTVTLDDKGFARVEGLPAAENYQIEMPDRTLALADGAASSGDSVA